MIVGRGAIARVLTDRDDRLYFASGVANSRETRECEFERERKLLLAQERHRHTVYFSSLCVFTSDNLYSRHKRNMEELVRAAFRVFTIIRLGNIDWADNPCQLFPYIKSRLASGAPFQVFDEYRYVVSVDEFLHWIDLIPDFNCEMNIPGRRMKASEIVAMCRAGNV